jgi:sortase (surface protein transpeptidase)
LNLLGGFKEQAVPGIEVLYLLAAHQLESHNETAQQQAFQKLDAMKSSCI